MRREMEAASMTMVAFTPHRCALLLHLLIFVTEFSPQR